MACLVCGEHGVEAAIKHIGSWGVDGHLCHERWTQFEALADGETCVIDGCPATAAYAIQQTPSPEVLVQNRGRSHRSSRSSAGTTTDI